jgi:hypothetical protein
MEIDLDQTQHDQDAPAALEPKSLLLWAGVIGLPLGSAVLVAVSRLLGLGD